MKYTPDPVWGSFRMMWPLARHSFYLVIVLALVLLEILPWIVVGRAPVFVIGATYPIAVYMGGAAIVGACYLVNARSAAREAANLTVIAFLMSLGWYLLILEWYNLAVDAASIVWSMPG
ncbi:MAG: hypothetical protein AAB582_03855 [Patescibacteria group bacterium]